MGQMPLTMCIRDIILVIKSRSQEMLSITLTFEPITLKMSSVSCIPEIGEKMPTKVLIIL